LIKNAQAIWEVGVRSAARACSSYSLGDYEESSETAGKGGCSAITFIWLFRGDQAAPSKFPTWLFENRGIARGIGRCQRHAEVGKDCVVPTESRKEEG